MGEVNRARELMKYCRVFSSFPEFILCQEGTRLIDNTVKDDFYELCVGDDLRNLAALRSKDGVCG